MTILDAVHSVILRSGKVAVRLEIGHGAYYQMCKQEKFSGASWLETVTGAVSIQLVDLNGFRVIYE